MSSLFNRTFFFSLFILLAAGAVAVLYSTGRLQIPSSINDLWRNDARSGGFSGGANSSSAFTKEAFDAKGNPIPAGGPVPAGDVVTYVLSYPSYMAATGSVITDTLTQNQTYVDPSLVDYGWVHLPGSPPGPPGVPYSIQNTTTYTSNGSSMSFSATVPASITLSGVSTAQSGDGTLPIAVGQRVYGIFHHQLHQQGRIFCWDLYSLQKCSGTAADAAGWPRNLGSPFTADTTLQIELHAVVGTRIYYASASYSSANNTTTPGIGCWETLTESACPFMPLPLTWAGKVEGTAFNAPSATNLNMIEAGVAGVPKSTDPNYGHVFIQAGDNVYCVDVATSGICWTSPSLNASNANAQIRSLIFDDDSAPTRLFVGVGNSSGGTNLACLTLTTGALCPGWTSIVSVSFGLQALSPVLNSSGSGVVGVCVHSVVGYPNASAAPSCYDSTGAPLTVSGVPSNVVLNAFHMPAPNKTHMLYSHFVYGVACRDFSTGAACTNFTPGWSASVYKDYGYVVDPAHSDTCLLGLGDAGTLWRFRNDGSLQDAAKNDVCQFPITYSFDINDRYCGAKPKESKWRTVSVANRPPELVSGVFEFFNSAGVSFGTATANAGNSFTVSVPAGSDHLLTVKFTPTYNPANAKPAHDYQITANFTADIAPQICYRAKVNKCGEAVGNRATILFEGPAGRVSQNASTDLGIATGEGCVAQSLLKVCKVAGRNVSVGTPFDFTANGRAFSVPAGPAPGGYCTVAGTFAQNANVNIVETGPPGYSVSNIFVAPPGIVAVAPDLSHGTVTVTTGKGVTEVTYTNDNNTGYLEICKVGRDIKGDFKFEVPGRGTVVVPAGACSPALRVRAGDVKIVEGDSGYAMVANGCYTFPTGRQVACDAANRTSVVKVPAGDLSTMTVVYITNEAKRQGIDPTAH